MTPEKLERITIHAHRESQRKYSQEEPLALSEQEKQAVRSDVKDVEDRLLDGVSTGVSAVAKSLFRGWRRRKFGTSRSRPSYTEEYRRGFERFTQIAMNGIYGLYGQEAESLAHMKWPGEEAPRDTIPEPPPAFSVTESEPDRLPDEITFSYNVFKHNGAPRLINGVEYVRASIESDMSGQVTVVYRRKCGS